MKFIHICSFKRPSLFWWGLCLVFVITSLGSLVRTFFVKILARSEWKIRQSRKNLKCVFVQLCSDLIHTQPRPKLLQSSFCVKAPSTELFSTGKYSFRLQIATFSYESSKQSRAEDREREEKQNRENQFCVCFWLLQKVLMSIEKKRSKRKSFKWSSPLASVSHRFFALFWVCEWIRSDRGLLLGVLDVSSVAICLHILLAEAGTQRMFSLLCNQSF